jgi:hypothetical protein
MVGAKLVRDTNTEEERDRKRVRCHFQPVLPTGVNDLFRNSSTVKSRTSNSGHYLTAALKPRATISVQSW